MRNADCGKRVAAEAGPARTTIGGALRHATGRLRAAGVETARLDAEVLLADILGLERWRLVADAGEALPAAAREAFEARVRRREAREPVAYIMGRKEFWSLEFAVSPDVLIPRPETECLVETAIRWLSARTNSVLGPQPSSLVVVDVGTGPGTILLSLAGDMEGPRYVGTDVSAAALALARRNAEAFGCASRVEWIEGDLFEALGALGLEARVDLLISNPPYVSEPDMDRLVPEIRRHEPALALCGGPDGLDVIRRLVAEAPRWLAPGGALLFEFGDGQATACLGLLRDSGAFGTGRIVRDLGGSPRAVIATLQGSVSRVPGSGFNGRGPSMADPEPRTRDPEPDAGSGGRRG